MIKWLLNLLQVFTGLRETGQPNSDIHQSKKLHKNCRENYHFPIFSEIFLTNGITKYFLLALSIQYILAATVQVTKDHKVQHVITGYAHNTVIH